MTVFSLSTLPLQLERWVLLLSYFIQLQEIAETYIQAITTVNVHMNSGCKTYKLKRLVLHPTILQIWRFSVLAMLLSHVKCPCEFEDTASNIFASIFAAVPCCKLENCCWDYKLVSDWSLAKQTSSFVYTIINRACVSFTPRIHTFVRGRRCMHVCRSME